MEYIDIIFDEKRHGLNHLARNILLNLDYFSFIQAKRSCKIIYEFIKSSDVEDIIFREKLHSDWAFGSPKILKLSQSQENLLADALSKKINSIMIFKEDTLFISAVNSVYSCLLNHETQSNKITDNETTGNKSERMKVFINPNTNRETNILTSMQILRDTYLLTGSRNGMLSVFNLRTGELESFKQLFGIISEIRCLDDLIATSHLGKQFDMGCITIRRFKSPEEMEVVWSVYEDVMPVFSMDFNYKYIVGLEWIETLDQAQIGILSVFKRDEGENMKERWNRGNLDLNHGFTTCCLFKEEFCALGSAGVQETRAVWDFSIIIVDLSRLTVIQVVKAHKSPIFDIQSTGNRLITKDKAGLVYLWDQNRLSDKDYRDEDVNSAALIRRLSEDNEQVESMTADLRKLVFVLKEGINCFSVKVQDFWSSPEIQKQ